MPTDHAGRHGMFARTYDKGGAYEWPDDLIPVGADADPVEAAVVAEPGAWEGQLENARDVMDLALEVERQSLDLGLGL